MRKTQPMTAEEFKEIRAAHKMTQAATAIFLDLTVRQIKKYEAGDAPVPTLVARSMRAKKRR